LERKAAHVGARKDGLVWRLFAQFNPKLSREWAEKGIEESISYGDGLRPTQIEQ
jgi:hypothetical protein